nr:pectate lyase [Prevotella sp.]
MKINKFFLLGGIVLSMNTINISPVSAQTEAQPAFPGAEGYGRYVTGGRGGKVYHVTNLEDYVDDKNPITGSLRWALTQSGTKTIVFDVAGNINLLKSLSISSNTTVAGQTSPGGICVTDYPVNVKGSNVIVRYMRFRLGNNKVTLDGADGWDGFGGMDGSSYMIDHCSISWSIDECCSFLGNKNTTVQWCLIAQSLVNAGHSKKAHGYGGNWGGDHASFHHNLLAHHTSRTPRLGPRPTTQTSEYMDMRNNVIYNYGSNGCYGGEGMKVNIINNYYKPGPGSPTETKGMRIAGIGIRTTEYVTKYPDFAPMLHVWGKFYVDGNVNSAYPTVTQDNWTNGMYNQIDASDCDGTYTSVTKDTIRLSQPLDIIYTTTHTASAALPLVIKYSGASNYRDTFDKTMAEDTENGTASAIVTGLGEGFVNTPYDNGTDPWPVLTQTTAPTDTDGDGIPDDYENTNGLNANLASDGALTAANGYTNLENYLNSLVSDITEAQNVGGTLVGDYMTTAISNVVADRTYNNNNVYSIDGKMVKKNISSDG